MKSCRLPVLLALIMLLATGCLVEEQLPPAVTPHLFATATLNAPATPTLTLPTATPLLPFLSDPALATPTPQGVAGRPCPYRLMGDFLALYASEPAIELSMGCPATKNEDTPYQLWTVTVRYQAFENGQVLWISNHGWEEGALIYVLRKNQIYYRYRDTFNPDWQPTATPVYEGGDTDPFAPPPGLLQPAGSIGHLWRGDPEVLENMGFATDAPIIMETQMLMLDYGELIRLPALGLMFALKAGTPGTWTIYALPGDD